MLVSELMLTFTEGKTAKRTVVGDTPIFEAGQLGKTPDGYDTSFLLFLLYSVLELFSPL